MIKKLETQFFKKTFKEIKEHPAFVDLKLKNQEIIDNRKEILYLLNNHSLCAGRELCINFSDHYLFERLENKKLFYKRVDCFKKKSFSEGDNEELDKKIKKLLLFSPFKFTNFEAKNCLKKIRGIMNESPNAFVAKINDDFDNLGSVNSKNHNLYLPCSNYKKEMTIFYAYSLIIKNDFVGVIRAQEMKENICDFFLNYSGNKEEIEKKYFLISNVPNLIILNFGYENDIGTIAYFLDFLPEFLLKRNQSNKSTLIITDILWENIEQNIITHKKFKLNNLIHNNKLAYLKSLFIQIFSNRG